MDESIESDALNTGANPCKDRGNLGAASRMSGPTEDDLSRLWALCGDGLAAIVKGNLEGAPSASILVDGADYLISIRGVREQLRITPNGPNSPWSCGAEQGQLPALRSKVATWVASSAPMAPEARVANDDAEVVEDVATMEANVCGDDEESSNLRVEAPKISIPFGTCERVGDNKVVNRKSTFEFLATRLKGHARAGRTKDGPMFLPATFTVGPHNKPRDYPGEERWRIKERQGRLHWLVCDVDGTVPAGGHEVVLEVLKGKGWAFTAYSSWSNGDPDKIIKGVEVANALTERFRIIIPLSRPVEPEEWSIVMGVLNHIIGGILGHEAGEPWRGYFTPRAPRPGLEDRTWFQHHPGAAFDVDAEVPDLAQRLEAIKREKAEEERRRLEKVAANRARWELEGFDENTMIARVKDALGYISPDCPYPVWTAVLMAIHDEFPEALGFELADGWSAGGSDYVGRAPLMRKWNGFTQGGGKSIRTLFEHAKSGGWDPRNAPGSFQRARLPAWERPAPAVALEAPLEVVTASEVPPPLSLLTSGVECIEPDDDGRFLLDDVANSRRFARDHKGMFCLVSAEKRFYRWTGSHWTPDYIQAAQGAAKQTARLIRLEYARKLIRFDLKRRGVNWRKEGTPITHEIHQRGGAVLGWTWTVEPGAGRQPLAYTLENRADGVLKINQTRVEPPDKKDKDTVVAAVALAQLAAHARVSASASKIKAMLDLAPSEPGFAKALEDFDQDIWLLNCPNCTLDLKTMETRPNRPEDRITKVTSVPYIPTATAPLWETFLATVTGGDQELRDYLQAIAGYALTGSTRDHALFIFFGDGGNGKSTFLETLASVLGNYATATPWETFLATHAVGSTGHSEHIANLRGARLVTAVEPTRGAALNEALVKQITGDDTLSASRKYGHQFTFKPRFKAIVAANAKPTIKGTDKGIWRRIRLVPFTVEISDDKKDTALCEKLRDEREGILAWCVEGARRWLEDGEQRPPCVVEATEAYRTEQDTIQGFVDEMCVVGSNFTASKGDLFATYKRWCEDAGLEHITKKPFGIAVQRRFKLTETRTGSARKWAGIGIRYDGLASSFGEGGR